MHTTSSQRPIVDRAAHLQPGKPAEYRRLAQRCQRCGQFVGPGRPAGTDRRCRPVHFLHGRYSGKQSVFLGNWMRYSAFDGSNTLLFASGDYLVGSDVVPEDSSGFYGCGLLSRNWNMIQREFERISQRPDFRMKGPTPALCSSVPLCLCGVKILLVSLLTQQHYAPAAPRSTTSSCPCSPSVAL
jgi:hypothetical protein